MSNRLSEQADNDVLKRLDALLNRDKVAAEAEIPLLTEIYQPPMKESSLGQEQIERLVELLLPEMADIMQQALTQHMQPALENMLRQHLQALAQRNA